MAKEKQSITVSKAMINFDEMKIVEQTKDATLVYDLNEILKKWHGIEEITFSIQSSKDVDPDDTEY